VWKDDKLFKQMIASFRTPFKQFIAALLIPLLTILLFQIITGLAGIKLSTFLWILVGVLAFWLSIISIYKATIDIANVQPSATKESTKAHSSI
jgi:hypothetical protein